ncbi:MAG: hypothetical protein WKG07_24415 [Hymenobacter sp.]
MARQGSARDLAACPAVSLMVGGALRLLKPTLGQSRAQRGATLRGVQARWQLAAAAAPKRIGEPLAHRTGHGKVVSAGQSQFKGIKYSRAEGARQSAFVGTQRERRSPSTTPRWWWR